MGEHFPRATISVSAWCSKCQKRTQHRVDDRRKGPCLDCMAKLQVQHAQNEIDRARRARQGNLFSGGAA